jgi:hypothetical protein
MLVVFFMLFFVSASMALAAVWEVPGDFATIQAAIDSGSVIDGDKILVGPGAHSGATVSKSVEIKGTDGAIITSGVSYNGISGLETAFRLVPGADGTEISHLMIQNNVNTGYFFAVFSRDVDLVSIHHLTIMNSVQAISNYNGDEWDISHNKMFGVNAVTGGGIGILIGAFEGFDANDNLIAHNTTEGEVGDVGFSGPGILLTSLHGASNRPGGEVSGNKVYKNNCTHTGSNGVAFEIDDVTLALAPAGDPMIFDNVIAFNDFRGSTWEIVLYPDESEDYNKFSRNLGSNRGEGADGLTPPEIFD